MDDQQPSTSKQPEEEIDESEEDSDDSDGTSEKCPICLLSFSNDQELGKPAVCEHLFCFLCIQEWSKVVQTCPIDRLSFQDIRVYNDPECAKLIRTVPVENKGSTVDLTAIEDFTTCEICRSREQEESMLLCDGCDKGLSDLFYSSYDDKFTFRLPYALLGSSALRDPDGRMVLR